MSEPVLRDTTRAPAGHWCWCPDIPAGQDPHRCGTRSHRAICRGDGGHVHKDDAGRHPRRRRGCSPGGHRER